MEKYYKLSFFKSSAAVFLLINLSVFIGLGILQLCKISFDLFSCFYNFLLSNLIWVLIKHTFKLTIQNLNNPSFIIEKLNLSQRFSHFVFLFSFQILYTTSLLPLINITYYAGLILVIFGLEFIMTVLVNSDFRLLATKNVAAIFDSEARNMELSSYLKQNGNLNFTGFINIDISKNTNLNESAHLHVAEQIGKAADSGVQEIYFLNDPGNIKNLSEIIAETEKNCIRLIFASNVKFLKRGLAFGKSAKLIVLSSRKEPLQKLVNRFQKRVLDIVISLFVIIFIFSWLYPLLALIIKFQSPGPVIFAQLRTGKNNRPFWCYKFRSMKVNDESDFRQACLNDERITPIGQFLRRTSIDEFPQFFNVLMGYMSLVGPRPHMVMHTNEYRHVVDKYMVRQFLKPGITGWAQINGYRGETKFVELMKRRVEHDLWYGENWTFKLDFKIITMTFLDMFKGYTTASSIAQVQSLQDT